MPILQLINRSKAAFSRQWLARDGRPDDCSGPVIEPMERRQLLSGEVLGTADAAGRLTLSYTTQGGAVSILQESSQGVSRIVGVDAATESPSLDRALTIWTDPRSGLAQGAAPSAEGLLVFVQLSPSNWSWRNLSAELGTPEMSNLTVFIGKYGSVNIAGVLATGDVAIFSNSGATAWKFQNLSDDLRAEGLSTPTFAGQLVSYITAWGGRNIAGLDAEGNIQALWWAPGIANNHWRTANLSVITGAPELSGSLTAYVTSWGGINLAGTDAAGKVSVTWWVPGKRWRTNNLTNQFNGPALASDSLSSYVTPWGGLNIVGRNAAGKIAVYWWAPGRTKWAVSANLVPGAESLAGRITGIASPTGTINLVAQSSTGSVLRFYWNPGDGGVWHAQDLSKLAKRPARAVDFSAVDFLDITGLGRSNGADWKYAYSGSSTIFGETESGAGNATMHVMNRSNGAYEMSMTAQSGDGLFLPRTTFERRTGGGAPGIYITAISGVGLGGDGAGWNLEDLQITPAMLMASVPFTDSAPFRISLPSGVSGDLAGTATATTVLDAEGAGLTVPDVPSAISGVIARRITLTLDLTASGWVDLGDGSGRLSGSLTEQLVLTFFAAPGVGTVKMEQNIVALISGFGQPSATIESETTMTLRFLGNTLRGTIQRGSLASRFLPSVDVTLRRVSEGFGQAPLFTSDVEPGKRTWVVIHGREDRVDSFYALAEAIDEHGSGDQVLVLDWHEGAADNPRALDGAAWIPSVATWAASVLISLGIAADDLILIGHSWGSFVANDIANAVPDPSEGTPGERIVALDPAQAAWGGYADEDVDFGASSAFSWAFDGNGLYGSRARAMTADETFRLDYEGGLPILPLGAGASQAHTAPRLLFEQIVRRNHVDASSAMASLFDLGVLLQPTARPWAPNGIPKMYEGEVTVEDADGESDWASSWDEVIRVQYVDRITGNLVIRTDS